MGTTLLGRTPMRTSLLLLAFSSALLAAPVVAQDEQKAPGPVRGGAGASFVLAMPQGEFADAVEAGYGIQLNGQYFLTRNGAVRVRLDGGFLQYGSESRERCFSTTIGCRVRLDLQTSNSIAWAGVGPELMLPSGIIRPYVNAGVGVSYFSTASHLNGDDDSENFANTTNLDDAVLAITGGAGLYVPVHLSEKVPFAIDLSARYHRNGVVNYLREGDIRDEPDGSISFTPRRTEANLITLQLGVSFGIRDNR